MRVRVRVPAGTRVRIPALAGMRVWVPAQAGMRARAGIRVRVVDRVGGGMESSGELGRAWI
jgi:hypothetical protein